MGNLLLLDVRRLFCVRIIIRHSTDPLPLIGLPPHIIDTSCCLSPQEQLASRRILQAPDKRVLAEQEAYVLERDAGCLRKSEVCPDNHEQAATSEEEEGAVANVCDEDGRNLRDGEAEEPVDTNGNSHGCRADMVWRHFTGDYPGYWSPS